MSARRKNLGNSRGDEQQRSRRRQREVFKKVLIVCEGKETEINYFNNFKQELRNNNIKVIPVHLDHTNADGIVNDAIDKMKDPGNPVSIDEGDSVWCVFDSDKNSIEQLGRAIGLANQHKIKIAFSNPCFEVWYLIHFQYSTAPLANCNAVIAKFKDIPELQNYEKTRCIYQSLKALQETAITNADNLITFHKGLNHQQLSKDSDPSTGVHKLVKYLNELKTSY